MATPHINGNIGDFAKTVLMPGDPKRAAYIANNFLQNVKLISEVRGILAFTGEYKGKKVSVMASGMGNASIGIYSYEVFNFFGVENIIRVGTCGVINKDYNVGDISVAVNSVSRSNYLNMFNGDTYQLPASEKLVKLAEKTAKDLNAVAHFGNTYSTDTFYGDVYQTEVMQKYDCFGVEMETAALYKNAINANKNAIAILTVSDNITTKVEMSSADRERSLNQMITFALEMAE